MARISHRREPAGDEIRYVEGGERLKYPVNLVAEAIERDARAAGFPYPLFRVKSGFRSIATQEVLWQRALERYGSAEEADDWVAPPGRSSHHTGGALDFDLGYSINSRNVDRIRATEAYRYLAHELAPKYKLAPYSREPWHWECDAACEDNILRMEGRSERGAATPSTSSTVGKVLLGVSVVGFMGVGGWFLWGKAREEGWWRL